MAQVSYGTITITDTNDIERIYTVYAKSTTNTTAPSAAASSWTESISTAPGSGDYIWQRTVVEKSGTGELTYSDPVCVTGPEGDPGATGKGVKSLVTQYYLSTSSSSVAGGSWSATPQSYPTTGTKYYWTKTITTYTDNTTYESTAVYDVALTSSVKNARDANVTAGEAKDIAQQTSLDVTNLQTRTKYFWTNLTAHTNGTSGWTKPDYPAGTFAASGINGTTFDYENSSTYGYNTLYSNGIKLRYNAINLGELTGTALTFYHPSTASQGAKAMELGATALKFYDATGSNIQAEFGGTKARVSGTIEALDGKIGSSENNYWIIDTFYDANQQESYSSLHSSGDSFIQLGDTNTWTIGTNKISSSWRYMSTSSEGITNPYYFRYKQFASGGDYYDYGIHIPSVLEASGENTNLLADKFLYIRRANYVNDSNLSQLELDSSWTYKFYIDGEGNLHAGDIYSHGTLISGTSAPYLLKSGGTITGNLEVNGTLTKGSKNVAYLSETPTSGRVLIADGTGGGIKTSGYTIATSVPQNALFTDEKVQTTKANTTKIYLAGTQTNGTNTGTLNFDEYVYVDTTAGALHATTFNGYTLAAASAKGVDTSMTSTSTSTNLPTTKAVADLIATYLPLAGGTVSGAVDINDEFYADSITAGNLIVNGAGRFTNGLYGDLTGNVTGSITGNAATADKVNHNLVIKLASGTTEGTNMFTFNGSVAKTVDITKSALGLGNVENKSSATIRGELTSANVTTALGFTPYDSTNPNGYTTNTGTVTSVAASGSGGITISGSPITTSGTITVGLNLSTAINGLGEGTSNANREDYVVVQYAGGGTTTTTYHRRKLKLLFAALNSSDITTALGYTPYNSTNPNGYTANTGTVTSVKVQGSNGLTGSGTVTSSGTITISHDDTSSQASSSNSGRTYIQSVTLDDYGHVTGLTTATETATDTHYTANLITGAGATAKANAAATNGNVYLNLVENSAVRNAHKITGSGTTTVTSDADGNITISSADSKVGTVTSITLTQGTGITIGSSGTAITTSGSRTIGLADNYGDTKNPYASKTARYVLAAPASAAGVPTFRALTGADVGLGNVLNAAQVTGIGQGADGKIRVYKGDSNYEDVAVEIVATESSSVASAQKLTSYGGSTKQPVYFPSTGTNAGKPVAISYTIETSVPSGAVFTDTTYTFAGSTNGFTVTPLNGTAQTVTVTPSIANNITGSGTSGYLAKFNGANTITNGPALGTDTTKFLNNKGEWATPSGAVTGVKGNSESTYRTGQVNITKANIGLGNVDNTADANKNVLTATKFSSSRTVALTGDVTGSASGDGSNGWSVATTVQDDSHNHTLATILPLKSKTFTNVIGTANNWAGATFFYGSIKPTTWDDTWRIKYKIHVYVPNHPTYNQLAEVTVSGKQGDFRAYASFNTIGSYYVCYYHELYRMKEAGFTNGYGHSLGVRFYSAYEPINTDYKRTIEIDILETENCSFDFYDSCLAYASIPGTGTTNYNTYTEMDFVSNGLQETGDANDVNYYNREYYGSRTTKNALYRYQFCVTDSTGQVIPINSVNNSVATNKTLMTDAFDPFGEIFQWVSTSTYAAGANVGNGNWYRQYLADLRYSFNCGGYDVDSTLTARLPLYLVVVPQGDGTVKLHSEPLSQTLPISDDGLLYIYLGRVYEDTKPYRVVLTFNHPVYWYKDGAIRQYTHMAQRAIQDGSGNTISSTYLPLSGGEMTGNLRFRLGDTDKHILFDYDGDETAGASWRISALGTGSNDTNYFAIQSGTSTTSATVWNNVIRLGQNTYDAAFGGNVYPLTNNSKTLGTSSLKWSNVYATTFTGALSGNATTASTFSSNASVTLTGDTTGTASSTKGWSITTKTDRISTVGDNRAVATTPNDYANKIIFQGLKNNSTIGSPSTKTYSYLIGLRGWSDNSGGNTHELAFNDDGIFWRKGATTSWDAWGKLINSINYTDYTVTKTGTGASGTWGISISGNANTATTATTATYSYYPKIVATNEIRFDVATKPSSATDLYFGYAWSDGSKDAKINNYVFDNGNSAFAGIKAANFNGYTIASNVPSGAVFTDTKNTAGSTNTNDALFLIGATTQAANPQTYSHDTVKINSTGQLISTGYEMTTSDSMSNAKCQMKYDDSLEAIVFSFS